MTSSGSVVVEEEVDDVSVGSADIGVSPASADAEVSSAGTAAVSSEEVGVSEVAVGVVAGVGVHSPAVFMISPLLMCKQ